MSMELKITRETLKEFYECGDCQGCKAAELCETVRIAGGSTTEVLNALVQVLWDDLDTAVSYLRQGKAQFAPGTTKSLVDDFLARMDAQQAGRTITLSEES